jgi:hypothetical protein
MNEEALKNKLNSNTKYKNITKNEAIKAVNNHLQRVALRKDNTHFSSINDAKDVWWINIPPKRFANDLHLLLKKADGFIWLKINANTFINPKNVFKFASDKNLIDLEIVSNKRNNYIIDIKSGGTHYNFNSHIEYEF